MARAFEEGLAVGAAVASVEGGRHHHHHSHNHGRLIVEEDQRTCCSYVGNCLWLVLGGGILFVGFYYALGGLLILSYCGAPWGRQLLKLGKLSWAPYAVHVHKNGGCICCRATSVLANLLWLPFGLMLALLHLAFALISIITIVGYYWLWYRQHLKLAQLALAPFGHHADAFEEFVIPAEHGHHHHHHSHHHSHGHGGEYAPLGA